MRASRLSMLALLHVRGRVSAQQLADELEVCCARCNRDIEALSTAGVPVYATRGRAGGFALLDGYRPGFTGLTADEADALFLTGLPGPAAELGLGAVLAATQVKLLAALPPDLRARAARIRDRFHLGVPGWLRDNEAPEHLALIADAVWSQRRGDDARREFRAAGGVRPPGTLGPTTSATTRRACTGRARPYGYRRPVANSCSCSDRSWRAPGDRP